MCSFRRFTCFRLVASGRELIAIEWPYSRNRMTAFVTD
jgi:hypothetical protein